MFDLGQTKAQILANVQAKLSQHRAALTACADLYSWSAGVAASDLVSLGFTPADAGALLAAISDAHAEHQIHETGLPPGSYPQPASAYVYGASQDTIIGP